MSEKERKLFKVIKDKNQEISWQVEEARKNRIRDQCKIALIDFYRLQSKLQEQSEETNSNLSMLKGE